MLWHRKQDANLDTELSQIASDRAHSCFRLSGAPDGLEIELAFAIDAQHAAFDPQRLCAEFPGVVGASDVWLPKDSTRIWTGSYKGKDWKHLVRPPHPAPPHTDIFCPLPLHLDGL